MNRSLLLSLLALSLLFVVGCGGGRADDDDDTPDPADTDDDGDGLSENEGDCDDGDAAISPNESEATCDGVDNDCDPGTPDDIDGDADGVFCSTDCDDEDAANFPGNTEICDGADNDCDGNTWATGGETDGDGDGSVACADCDDADPNSTTVSEDSDCDGLKNNLSVGGMTLITLGAGSFEMGCTDGQSSCEGDELPVRTVTLTHDFWMGETEVTQGQWHALIDHNQTTYDGASYPMEMVTWHEGLAFANDLSAAQGLPRCYALDDCDDSVGWGLECSVVTVSSATGSPYDCEGYRLPTEAEWEYAARAGTDLLYAGGNNLDAVGWYPDNAGGTTHAVATKQPNAWGLYDMSGNVEEWVWDPWVSTTDYNGSAETDPEGNSVSGGAPWPGTWARAIRGGHCRDPSTTSRVSARHGLSAGGQRSWRGFRLARTAH
jgi:formylglycine-generating enzyme required for sulfatase activity